MSNKIKFKQLATVAAILLFAASMQSCKTKSTAEKSTKAEQTGEIAVVQSERFKNLTAKVSVAFAQSSVSVKGTLKMVPDSALMLSIQPIFGIEMARLLCTADSVYFVDKYRQKVYVKSYQDIYRHGSINLQLIQGLMCNMVWGVNNENNADKVKYLAQEGGKTLVSFDDDPVYSTFLFDSNNDLLQSTIKNDAAALYLAAEYSDFSNVGSGVQYPMSATFVYQSDKKQYAVEVTSSSVSINKAKNIGITIPSNYSNAELDEIMNILP